jgi:hypothetical protein
MNRLILLLALLCGTQAFALPECGANQSKFVQAAAGAATMTNAALGTALNNVVVYGYYNDYACTSTNVAYQVTTADNTATNNYGLAILGPAGGTPPCTTGALLGSTFAPSTGGIQQTWSGGTCNVPQGQVFLAVGSTCVSACAVLAGDCAKCQWFWNIAANRAANTPWTFNGSGFSGFTSANLPISTLTLSTASTDTIVTNTYSITSTSISGSLTTYTGTITGGGASALAGQAFTMSGWTAGNVGNNGTFICTTSTITTLTLANASGVTVSASGTGNAGVATVTVTQSQISHVFPGSNITVTGSNVAGFNCANCDVISTTPASGIISYSVPPTTYSGLVTSGSISAMALMSGASSLVPPNLMIY